MNPEQNESPEFEIEADDRAFRLRASSTQRASRARGILADYIRKHAAPPEACEAAELIAGELLGNVVRHAPGPFEIFLEWDAHAGVLHVIDTGSGYALRDMRLPDTMAESARGLYIVLAFGAKDLRTYRAEDGRHVTRVVLPTRKAR